MEIRSVFFLASAFGMAFGGEWSDCSKSCGGGTKTRTSQCFSGFCYRYESVFCNTQPCGPSTWNTYTPCSQTCGGGHRYRVKPCAKNDINLCKKTYEECNTQPCPGSGSCYGDVRFGTKSLCCDKTTENCGVPVPNPYRKRNKRAMLIVGGTKSKLGEWPWAAAIVIKKTKTTHCGGSLIHKDWVLSAAHCMKYSPTGWYDKDQLYVMLGSISIKNPDASKQVFEIKRFIPHENYKDPEHDVGLIQLKKSAKFNEYVNPICLPNAEEVQLDLKCVAIGWGIARQRDIQSHITSDVLYHVQLSNLPKDACVNGMKDLSWRVDKYNTVQNLCFGHLPGGKDTCFGDSGGPIMCQRCSSCGWYVAGITSYGPDDKCAEKGQPAVYMYVKSYESWIRNKIYGHTSYVHFSC